MPLPPPRWWERLLGCRVAIVGTGDAMQRHLVLAALGLCDTDDETSDASEEDAARRPRKRGPQTTLLAPPMAAPLPLLALPIEADEDVPPQPKPPPPPDESQVLRAVEWLQEQQRSNRMVQAVSIVVILVGRSSFRCRPRN